MPIKRMAQFEAWSYSRLADYEECPFKAKLKHLDKIKEPGSPALDRGSQIHKEAAAYATKQISVMPTSLARFPEEFAGLRARSDVECELQVALTSAWQPCEWFGPAAWLRVVIDATYAGATPEEAGRTVIDFKTGKVRAENADQLDLYGLVMLACHAGIKRVDSALWYLDQGEIVSRALARPEATALRKRWEKRVKPMLADQTFTPTPGNGCRWCFYGQGGRGKGGPGLCRF